MLTNIIVAGSAFAERGEWDGGPGPWWPIFPILWFLLIAGLVFAVIRGRRRWSGPSHSGEARLAERYAAGEIDEDEYRSRLAVLKERK